MNMKMKPYNNYKEIDLPWLNQIPYHWEIYKVKHKFKLIQEPSYNKKPVILSLTQRGIVIRDIETNVGQIAKNYEGYNTVRKGDISLNPMDLESGAASISKYNGVISNAYFTIRPKEKDVNTKFYSLYFNMHYHKRLFYPFGKGVGRPEGSGGRWSLNRNTFKNFNIIVPPKNEQDKIVAFLDNKLEKIDKFIDLKTRQIELLKEQKEAMINKVVTNGLDDNIGMKDSGVEWLEEIPENWEVIKLKYIAEIRTGNKDTIDKIDDGIYPFFVRSPNIENIDTYSFNGEAILTAGDGVGAGKVFHHYNGKFDYHQRVYNIHNIDDSVYGEYLHYFMKYNFSKLIKSHNAKSTVDSIRLPMLKNFRILKPTKSIQVNLVKHLKKEEKKINKTIDLYQKEIDLIKEYKMSLISTAVTGKIDLRDYEEVN